MGAVEAARDGEVTKVTAAATFSWSEWRPFPDPRLGGILVAPFGTGCYQLRRRSSRRMVLFGHGGNVAARMTSLLPIDLGGSGTRSNSHKREYVKCHLSDIEYRTIPCRSRDEAIKLERELKIGDKYRFPT